MSSRSKRAPDQVGLYLCVFASPEVDDEIDGVEVGAYDDFHRFRTVIAEHLEDGLWGSRFPTLMTHPDSDGQWSPQESVRLASELRLMEEEFAKLPPVAFEPNSWQQNVARTFGVRPTNLADCFIDVDGELLIRRLRNLAELSIERGQPISFQ